MAALPFLFICLQRPLDRPGHRFLDPVGDVLLAHDEVFSDRLDLLFDCLDLRGELRAALLLQRLAPFDQILEELRGLILQILQPFAAGVEQVFIELCAFLFDGGDSAKAGQPQVAAELGYIAGDVFDA